jgi:HNH endonuclease
MVKNIHGSEVCPYCNNPILKTSDEHIFPEFMGGRKTIDSCVACDSNNIFGGTFEGRVSRMLHALHISISTWGLALKKTVPTWRSGYESQGLKFNLSIGKTNEMNLTLSKPIVEKDDQGKTTSVTYATEKEARRAAKSAFEKGKVQRIVIEKIPMEVPFTGAAFNFELSPDCLRLALKMCFTLSTLLPEITVEELAHSQAILRGDQRYLPENVIPAFDNYSSLDSKREALCHVIYVERNKSRIYGVVQLYGVIQVYCDLGEPVLVTRDRAILGVLDPLTGNEEFTEITPLTLTQPTQIPDTKQPEAVGNWRTKFRQSAIDRGATDPPNLSGTLD